MRCKELHLSVHAEPQLPQSRHTLTPVHKVKKEGPDEENAIVGSGVVLGA